MLFILICMWKIKSPGTVACIVTNMDNESLAVPPEGNIIYPHPNLMQRRQSLCGPFNQCSVTQAQIYMVSKEV